MKRPTCLCLSVQDEKMNVEALSRAELLTLLSILEGELEAQDVVIHALRVSPHVTLAVPLKHTLQPAQRMSASSGGGSGGG